MGAVVGVEYIQHFANARAADETAGEDLECPYYIANWFGPRMAQAGHTLRFLRSEHDVKELHLRDESMAGDDVNNADSVDLYLIITHGSYNLKRAELLFDSPEERWKSSSTDWRFGDNCNMEWLMIYGCHTVDKNEFDRHQSVFQRLHLMCGAYGSMHDAWSVDEVGADTADNLNSGMLVSDSWGDGVSDWYVANHPIVVSVERYETYNGGHILWPDTVIGCDHVWGKGYTFSDIRPEEQYWMAAHWWDGGLRG
jgi:hypothetical protein